jgi:hypothetical protein
MNGGPKPLKHLNGGGYIKGMSKKAKNKLAERVCLPVHHAPRPTNPFFCFCLAYAVVSTAEGDEGRSGYYFIFGEY